MASEYSLDLIMEDLEALLQGVADDLGVALHEGGIPDIDTVEVDTYGAVLPYMAYTFGEIEQWGATSFLGPVGDDYVLPVRVTIVTHDSKLGRKFRTAVTQSLLGYTTKWAGNMRVRPIGDSFPIRSNSGSREAVITPCNYALPVQLAMVQ